MGEKFINKNDIHELDRWGFDCPLCKHWNETEEDPDYQESVFCEGCESHIKIKENQ